MITRWEARSIAIHHLEEKEKMIGVKLILDEDETLEKDFGWVFFYNSKDYVENDDFSSMMVGHGPFIVCRGDGVIHQTGTAKSVEEYIEEFEALNRLKGAE